MRNRVSFSYNSNYDSSYAQYANTIFISYEDTDIHKNDIRYTYIHNNTYADFEHKYGLTYTFTYNENSNYVLGIGQYKLPTRNIYVYVANDYSADTMVVDLMEYIGIDTQVEVSVNEPLYVYTHTFVDDNGFPHKLTININIIKNSDYLRMMPNETESFVGDKFTYGMFCVPGYNNEYILQSYIANNTNDYVINHIDNYNTAYINTRGKNYIAGMKISFQLGTQKLRVKNNYKRPVIVNLFYESELPVAKEILYQPPYLTFEFFNSPHISYTVEHTSNSAYIANMTSYHIGEVLCKIKFSYEGYRYETVKHFNFSDEINNIEDIRDFRWVVNSDKSEHIYLLEGDHIYYAYADSEPYRANIEARAKMAGIVEGEEYNVFECPPYTFEYKRENHANEPIIWDAADQPESRDVSNQLQENTTVTTKVYWKKEIDKDIWLTKDFTTHVIALNSSPTLRSGVTVSNPGQINTLYNVTGAPNTTYAYMNASQTNSSHNNYSLKYIICEGYPENFNSNFIAKFNEGNPIVLNPAEKLNNYWTYIYYFNNNEIPLGKTYCMMELTNNNATDVVYTYLYNEYHHDTIIDSLAGIPIAELNEYDITDLLNSIKNGINSNGIKSEINNLIASLSNNITCSLYNLYDTTQLLNYINVNIIYHNGYKIRFDEFNDEFSNACLEAKLKITWEDNSQQENPAGLLTDTDYKTKALYIPLKIYKGFVSTVLTKNNSDANILSKNSSESLWYYDYVNNDNNQSQYNVTVQSFTEYKDNNNITVALLNNKSCHLQYKPDGQYNITTWSNNDTIYMNNAPTSANSSHWLTDTYKAWYIYSYQYSNYLNQNEYVNNYSDNFTTIELKETISTSTITCTLPDDIYLLGQYGWTGGNYNDCYWYINRNTNHVSGQKVELYNISVGSTSLNNNAGIYNYESDHCRLVIEQNDMNPIMKIRLCHHWTWRH